jgi:hypothetical protein
MNKLQSLKTSDPSDGANASERILSSRREWFARIAGCGVIGVSGLGVDFFGGLVRGSDRREKKKVAAVVTEYRKRSHADVLLGKILEGWKQDGGIGPGLELVSLYVDQYPAEDMSVALASKYGFRLCQSIEESLTLGGQSIGVDGVLSIGEHGDYPWNDFGQHLYPRKRFFEEITDAMRKAKHFLPSNALPP